MTVPVEQPEVAIPLMDIDSSTALTFKNVTFTITEKSTSKCLLDNVSGSFHSGRLAAIIGPSGAGKSTLLNVLSGFNSKGVTGQILVNNQVVERERYRQMVAYNEQDVSLLPNITVRETLGYTANLKMPSSVASIQRTKVVNEIISLLGLEKCANTQVKNLSGGEKKRLSIGQDLITNPRIMFFDEPTSGLDSESSYQVISYLKELAQQGRCVVSVIHQPSSDLLELFDDIYVVAQGHCLYKGTLQELTPTFAEVGLVCPQYHNRADFAIKMASKSSMESEKIQMLISKMESAMVPIEQNGFSQYDKLEVLDDCRGSSQYPISHWRQFLILTHRTTIGTLRNFTLMVLRFLGHIMYALIVGTVYYQIGNDGAKVLSNVALLMMFLMFIMFSNSMTVVLTFPLEMSVFIREYKSNCYSVAAYFFSKIVSDFPFLIAGLVCLQLITYNLTDQPNETDRVLMFALVCILTGWFSQIYGLLGGSIFPIDVSPFVVPTSFLPTVLFCGFFIRYDELMAAFKVFTYVSPMRFAFEGSILALYGFDRKDLDCTEIFCYYRKPRKVLEMMNMENGNFWYNMGGLAVTIVLMHISVYICLRLKVR